MITDFIPLEDYKELDRFTDDLENKDIIQDRILSWLISIEKIKTTHGGGWFIEDPEKEELEFDLERANEKIEDLETEIADLEEELEEVKRDHRKTADELERAEQELSLLNKRLDLLGE